MRKLAVLGAMMAGLLVAGCAAPGGEHQDAWQSLVDQDYNGARAHYETILASNPNDPYANLNLGVVYEEMGDTAMATKHYQLAIANGAESPIMEVTQDGNTAARSTTVKQIAQENLAGL